eukprot:6802465-Prymnesium_polylepis.1
MNAAAWRLRDACAVLTRSVTMSSVISIAPRTCCASACRRHTVGVVGLAHLSGADLAHPSSGWGGLDVRVGPCDQALGRRELVHVLEDDRARSVHAAHARRRHAHSLERPGEACPLWRRDMPFLGLRVEMGVEREHVERHVFELVHVDHDRRRVRVVPALELAHKVLRRAEP